MPSKTKRLQQGESRGEQTTFISSVFAADGGRRAPIGPAEEN